MKKASDFTPKQFTIAEMRLKALGSRQLHANLTISCNLNKAL